MYELSSFLNFRCGGGTGWAAGGGGGCGGGGVDDCAYASVCLWSVGAGGRSESVCVIVISSVSESMREFL